MVNEIVFARVSARIGPWRTRDNEPAPAAPHGDPLLPMSQRPLRIEYADKGRLIPLAVWDDDGCRAEVLSDPVPDKE